MIYEATERAIVVATANFATDLKTLIETDHGLATGLEARKLAETEIFDRVTAEVFSDQLGTDRHAKLHGLGIYGGEALTQAKLQSLGWRESDVSIVFDYYALHRDDPSMLGKVTELAAEAIMRTVDRMAGSGGVLGAGEGFRSCRVTIAGTARVPKQQNFYQDRCTVVVPVVEEETGL